MFSYLLQDICETTLKSMIDNDSVLYLLGIADRYNAGSLKANCFAYISQHEDVVKSDIIYDLPKALQVRPTIFIEIELLILIHFSMIRRKFKI